MATVATVATVGTNMRRIISAALITWLCTGCFSVAGSVLGDRRATIAYGQPRTYAFEGLVAGAVLDLVLLAALGMALGGTEAAPPGGGDCPSFDPRPCG
jgi:hypothetical protein